MKYIAILLLVMCGCSALPKLEQTKLVERKVDAVNSKVDAVADAVIALTKSHNTTNEVVHQIAGSQHVLEGLDAEHKLALDLALEESRNASTKSDIQTKRMEDRQVEMDKTMENVETGVQVVGATLIAIVLKWAGKLLGGPGGMAIEGLGTLLANRRQKKKPPDE